MHRLLLVVSLGLACQSSQEPASWENPNLAPTAWPIIHGSSAQQAMTPLKVPDGSVPEGLTIDYFPGAGSGPGGILVNSAGDLLTMTLDFLNGRRIWHRHDSETLEVLAQVDLDAVDILSGLYSFVDNEDCVWTSTDAILHRLCPEPDGFREDMTIDLIALAPDSFEPDEAIVGMNPLFLSPGLIDIAFATSGTRNVHKNDLFIRETVAAKAGVLRITADRQPLVFVHAFSGEATSNSIAIAPSGIYVLTNRSANRLVLDGSDDLTVVWSTPYESGKPIEAFPCDDSLTTTQCMALALIGSARLTDGSGTTPTLLGEDLQFLAFADGSRPMRVLVLNTSDGSALEIDEPVPFPDDGAQTENTFSALNRRFAIENNNPDGAGVAAYDIACEDGSERVQLAWVNLEVVAPNNVPLISGGSNAVLVWERQEESDWFGTALDLSTGDVRWRQPVGTGSQWDSVFAPLSVDNQGRLLIWGLGGLVRLRKNPS